MLIKTNASSFENQSTGLPIEISDSTKMTEVMVSENVGKFYKYIGETTTDFVSGSIYQVVDEDTLYSWGDLWQKNLKKFATAQS